MSYEKTVKKFENTTFTRNDLFEALQKESPGLTYNSFKWIVAELIKNKQIYRIDYNLYSQDCSVEKKIYTPFYSENTQKLKHMIEGEYPLADFCFFEAYLLNEFLNHQIANNTIIIQMEKEVGGFLFDYLQDEWDGRILYKPKQNDFERYWSKDCVIIVDKVSEAPKKKEKPHDMTIEKLLVDIFAEPMIRILFSPGEYLFMVETALSLYNVDKKRLFRYARRRNAADKVMEYIK